MRQAPTDAPMSSSGVLGQPAVLQQQAVEGQQREALGSAGGGGNALDVARGQPAVAHVAQGARAGTQDEWAGTVAHRGSDASSSHDGSAALRYDSAGRRPADRERALDTTASIVVCAAAVAGLLVAERRDSQVGKWLTKPVASAAFIAVAVISGALDSDYGRLILLGLGLCLLGDVLLIPEGRLAVFRAGVFAFLAGHVAFAAAFLTQPRSLAWLAVAAVALALALCGRLALAQSPPAGGHASAGAGLLPGHRRHDGIGLRSERGRRSAHRCRGRDRVHGFRHFGGA